jgi:hypothetical protein
VGRGRPWIQDNRAHRALSRLSAEIIFRRLQPLIRLSVGIQPTAFQRWSFSLVQRPTPSMFACLTYRVRPTLLEIAIEKFLYFDLPTEASRFARIECAEEAWQARPLRFLLCHARRSEVHILRFPT